jgi:hypothetical protein
VELCFDLESKDLTVCKEELMIVFEREFIGELTTEWTAAKC